MYYQREVAIVSSQLQLASFLAKPHQHNSKYQKQTITNAT